MTEKQDKSDRLTQRVLSIGTLVLCSVIVLVLLIKEVPPKNEMLIGTAIGFIFGNMVGPVYRMIFGGPDVNTQKVAEASSDAIKRVAVAASATNQTDQMDVKADNVKVEKVTK